MKTFTKQIYKALIVLSLSLPFGKGWEWASFAQNIGISSTGATPDNSAMLDVVSTTKGMLIPRMTGTEKYAITTPATGLLIFQTDTIGFWYYDGTKWIPLVSSTSSTASPSNAGWLTTGNSGTAWNKNFLGTTDNVSLRVKTNNTERMIVDSNGFVGIGTTSPTTNLYLQDTRDYLPQINIESIRASSNNAGYFLIRRANGTPSSKAVVSNGDILGTLMWQGYDGTAYVNSAYMEAAIGSAVSSGIVPSELKLYTTNNSGVLSEKMKVTGTGNVGIGTASPSQKLQVAGGNIMIDNAQNYCGKNAVGSARALLTIGDAHGVNDYTKIISGGAGITFLNAAYSTELFTIDNGGNVGITTTSPGQKLDIAGGNGRVQSGYNWLTNSDVRYKTNITTLTGSLEKVLAIRGVRYDLKNDTAVTAGKGKHIGYIAQELEKQFPEFVITGKDGYKSVAYDKMTAVLVEAIKEQQLAIDSLQEMLKQVQHDNAKQQAEQQALKELIMTNTVSK